MLVLGGTVIWGLKELLYGLKELGGLKGVALFGLKDPLNGLKDPLEGLKELLDGLNEGAVVGLNEGVVAAGLKDP